MAIARGFVLTNASRAENNHHTSKLYKALRLSSGV